MTRMQDSARAAEEGRNENGHRTIAETRAIQRDVRMCREDGFTLEETTPMLQRRYLGLEARTVEKYW